MSIAERRRCEARKGLAYPTERPYTTMSQQNFVEQFRLFMEYARKNAMHSRECMLWCSLFYLANEEATYNADTQTYEWPDDFFAVSNGELNSYGRFDKQAVESLRNRLKQRGLIDFIKGNRNNTTPMYKIHYFIKAGNKIIPNIYANNTPNNDANNMPNNAPNNHANHDANYIPNMPPTRVNINNNIPGNTGSGLYFPDDEEEQEEELVARARAREEILSAWRFCFGKEPTPLIVNELARRGALLGFGDGVIAEAIRTAAWRDAASPMDYITTTLVDWHEHHIKTVDDVGEYAVLYDAQLGKLGYAAQSEAPDRIRAFTEDRETPEQRESREKWERRRREEREKQRELIAANQAARAAE